MKITIINRHQARIAAIRAQLDDNYSHWSEIRRPEGMKKYIFRNKIARLCHEEGMVEQLLEEGLRQYIARSKKEN